MLDCLKAGFDNVRAAKCPPGSDMSPVGQSHTRSHRIISTIITIASSSFLMAVNTS